MHPPTWLDADRRALLALAFALAALGVASWRPIPAGVWHDDGVYLLIGKALAEGEGLRYSGVPGDVPAVKFPPLYPAVLAGLWLVFRTLGAVTLVAVWLNLALLAAAGTLLAVALRRAAGLEPKTAVGLAAFAFVGAHVWRVGLVTLSEPLFIALACAALACWATASRPGERRGAALLSALLTAAVLTRSAGLALVLAFGLALWQVRGLRAALAVALPPLAASVGWGAWAAARAEQIPSGMRDVLGPYGPWLARQTMEAPGQLAEALPGHLLRLVDLAFGFLLPGLSGPAFYVGALGLMGSTAFGLALLHGRLPPLTWAVGAYVAMLLLWPYLDWRLLVPLHPLLAVAAGVGALELWRLAATKATRTAVALLGLAWVALYPGVSLWRAYDGWTASAYRLRAGRLAAAVETLERTAPPDAVVGAPEFWAALHLHGGWRVSPSALFAPRAPWEGLPAWGTPEEQIALWWEAGIDHLLLEQGGTIHGAALDLVEERCPGAVGVLATMPPQMLVRIGWGDGCAARLGLGPTRAPPATPEAGPA
jgi:hypothetical protein